MPRNVEVKARARDWAQQLRQAEAMADSPAQALHQTDTFFRAAHGRLKLREFANGCAELIQYERPDTAGPKASRYTRVPIAHPAALKTALTAALGVRITVTKSRTLLHAGAVRIHFDEVEGLGSFIELEVVLQPTQIEREGHAIAMRIVSALGIQPEDLISGAYADLLQSGTHASHSAQDTSSSCGTK